MRTTRASETTSGGPVRTRSAARRAAARTLRSLATASLLAIVVARPALRAGEERRGVVALDADGVASLVIARDAVAAAAGDLFGDAAEEWVAALSGGGIVVRSGDDGRLGLISDLGPRALAVGDGRLYAALEGGILEVDVRGGEARFVAAVSAAALAAGDLDRDGADEVVAALDDGRLLLLDLDAEATYPLGGLRAADLAAGDLLGRGYGQLALRLPAGGVRIVDFFEDDAPLCYLGDAGPATSRGLSALPSGLLATLDAAGSFRLLDPRSCEILELDPAAVDFSHETVFSSARLAPDAPAGGQLPGDCNQDGGMDISDAVCLLSHLFLGSPSVLPCGDGSAVDAANIALLGSNGDAAIDLSDAVYVLSFLFVGGPPPVLGRECAPIAGCPVTCP